MKALGWYSKIVIMWMQIGLLYEIAITRGSDVETAFWAIIVFIPIMIYIVKTKENK